LYRDISYYFDLIFNESSSNFNFMMPVILFVILYMLFCTDTFAQWINNPTLNTELVSDVSDPINILTVRDLSGGEFVFWQDNKNGFQNEIYFERFNSDGKVTGPTGQTGIASEQSGFRPGWKKITSLSGPEENPVCANETSNSAIVIWTDYTYSKAGNLFAQCILNNGNFGWTDKGLQLTNTDDEISGYSICSDKSGSFFTAYISKDPEINGSYKVKIQKISFEGKFLFDQNAVLVYESRGRKNMTNVVPDDEGGVYVFWIETQNSKRIIMCQHINKEGKGDWEGENSTQQDKIIEISNNAHNVTTYSVTKVNNNSVYIAWQTQKSSKDIYHQLIDNKGRSLWGRGGKQITSLRGNQFDPQSICFDSTIILSWTNEQSNNSDIYVQKYDMTGRPLWNKYGIPVIKYRGRQFGQHIVSDGKGGAIISWIDRRDKSALADIYAQRVDSKGKIVWDSLGVGVALNHNTPKSYLSLIEDEAGSVVVIFKNSRNNKSKIYGQKIFSTGYYNSQIESFKTTLIGDSIKISWNSSGGQNGAKYNVERAVQTQDGNFKWDIIATIGSLNKSNTLQYEYFDIPAVTGTLYYRVTQTDSKGNIQKSNINQINYFGSSPDIIVTQNTPNPFADSTVISFYLPNPEMVEIEFFNDHVEKISEMDKSLPAGKNSITFYSKGLKPGIYFYRLRVDNFVDVKKMIITD